MPGIASTAVCYRLLDSSERPFSQPCDIGSAFLLKRVCALVRFTAY